MISEGLSEIWGDERGRDAERKWGHTEKNRGAEGGGPPIDAVSPPAMLTLSSCSM